VQKNKDYKIKFLKILNNCIKEFRKEYLEAGDIMVYVKAKDKENQLKSHSL